MSARCYAASAMDLGVLQLRSFSISLLSSVLGKESGALRLEHSSSGASVVAIDNKIEQAMDLVKSHLMYAVREEVEVLKEQIKELLEKNSQLETENSLLKTLASPEQMAQFHAQVQSDCSPTGGGGGVGGGAGGGVGGGGGVSAGSSPPVLPPLSSPAVQNSGPSA